MRPIDDDGNPVQIRGRQFYATATDTVDFLNLVLENIPESKLYDDERIGVGQYPEITPEAWAALENPSNHALSLLFHRGDWTPEFESYRDDRPEMLRLANGPTLSSTIFSWTKIKESYFKEIGCPIRRPGQGVIHTNNIVGDVWGKKMIDKVFRLHGKIFSNKARWINLITGEEKMSVRYHNWCGRDMARLCNEEEDLYLAVEFDYANNQYLGLLPDV